MNRETAERSTIIRGLVGSTVHGLNVNDGIEDRDEMGICVEPFESAMSLREPFAQFIYRSAAEREGRQDARSSAGDLDLVIYSFRKWIRLALKGNPTILLLLFTPDEQLVTCDELGVELRALVPANFPVARLREGLAATPSGSPGFAGLQVDYSLAERLPFENGAARLSADYGLGVTARSPLAGGHLARRAWSGGLGARPHPAAGDRHAAIAAEGIWPVLSALARSHRCSPAQIALSWVLAHPQVTSVLVSVSSVDQLRELLAATRLELPAEHIARLGTTPVRPWPVPLRAEIGPPAGH